jgi:hypothetical protein
MIALVVVGYNDRFIAKQVHLKLRKLQSESQGLKLQTTPSPNRKVSVL